MTDHEDRLRAMVAPGQQTWDLSPDDVAAIGWALAEVERLRALDGIPRDRPDPTFAVELATYESIRPHLLDTFNAEGWHAVIKDKTCIGIERTYDRALELGYRICGLVPFLVKKIERVDTVHHV